VGRRLADGAAHENHIRDPEHETTTSVVGQGARPKRAKKSTEGRGGSDQFLREEALDVSRIIRTRRGLKTDLLTGREHRWTKIGTDGDERTRDDTRIVTCWCQRRR